ncbi:MAG: damage-control phosphatase ARMT1 family protein [Anaerostipes sp.]|jgi:uncharacterized protein with ATP-grasp and redox domains
MRITSMCMSCLLSKQEKLIRDYEDEDKKDQYLRQVMKLMIDDSLQLSAPECLELIEQLHEEYFGKLESNWETRKRYNEQVMEKVSYVSQVVEEAEDPLAAAIKAARVGNYIDSMALPVIDKDQFESLLYKIEEEQLEEQVYESFKEDLKIAKSLVYITDNCGEIVFDKVCLDEISKLYPDLKITVLVRGGEVINDATMEDARQIGMTETYEVMGNGTRIPGTSLRKISNEARELLEAADVIVAKGQGNHESLSGCGLNIYYLLLCKCSLYTKKFGVKQLSGIFVKECP